MTKEAFERQVIALRKQLYYVSYSLLPNSPDQEDAVQECIYKALQKRETLKQDGYLKTWLMRILINVCHEMRRKRRREFPSEEIAVVRPDTANGGIFEAIIGLDEKYRLPIVLHHHTGHSVQEVAQILRLPEGTVKSRLSRGRTILARELNEREALA